MTLSRSGIDRVGVSSVLRERTLRTLVAMLMIGTLGACASSSKSVPAEPMEDTVTTKAPTPKSIEPRESVAMATDNALIKTIYFDFDQSVLGEEALTSLRAHARLLRENPDRSMIIEGHADERGSREYNLALGQSRAEVVRSFLLTQGVHARQIETVSYGEEKPESTAHSETGWSLNRRAFLSYSLEVAGTTPKLARQ